MAYRQGNVRTSRATHMGYAENQELQRKTYSPAGLCKQSLITGALQGGGSLTACAAIEPQPGSRRHQALQLPPGGLKGYKT